MSLKLWYRAGIGIGDVFFQLANWKSRKALIDIKRKNPGTKLLAVVTTNSHDASLLFHGAEFADDVIEVSWPVYVDFSNSVQSDYWKKVTNRCKEAGYTHLSDFWKQNKNFELSNLDVSLNVYEEIQLNEIISQGKYVFIHLYSTSQSKIIAPYVDIKKMIDRLIDDYHYNVVFVGKSHGFNSTWHEKGYPNREEVLQYNRNGLFNFTIEGNCDYNIRLITKLLKHATKRILAESVFPQACAMYNVDLVCLLAPGSKTWYESIRDSKTDQRNCYFDLFKSEKNKWYDIKEINGDVVTACDSYLK